MVYARYAARWESRKRRYCTFLHILCNCEHTMKEDKFARQSGQVGHIGRIMWRHDSVMFAILRGVIRVMNRFKKMQQECKRDVTKKVTHTAIRFHSTAGVKYPTVQVPVVQELLATAMDWKLLFDINAPEFGQRKEQPFPPEIVASQGGRPDGVIWSCSTKTVIWIVGS